MTNSTLARRLPLGGASLTRLSERQSVGTFPRGQSTKGSFYIVKGMCAHVLKLALRIFF